MISSPQNFELPTFFTSLRAFTTAAWVVLTPRAHSGRLIERLGRCDRRLYGAGGDRHAGRGIADQAGKLLRQLRPEANHGRLTSRGAAGL